MSFEMCQMKLWGAGGGGVCDKNGVYHKNLFHYEENKMKKHIFEKCGSLVGC